MRWNGERVRQAREICGLTQEVFAQQLGVSQPHISLVEQNAQPPSDSLMEAISLATGFPATFFLKEMIDFPLGSLLYRKTRTIPSASAAQLRQTARMVVNVVAELGRNFKPISVQIPRLGCEPEEAAQQVRSSLGVSPDEPLVGLARKLERSGAIIFYLPVQVEGFDAFSAWSDEDERRPIICLRPLPAGDRIRKTLAHELGHLVLHQDFLGSPGELDDQADAFAGELLFPTEAMRRELILPLTLTGLADLKRRWGVSMAAIVYYAERRGIITLRQKSYLRGKLQRKGWLDQEPIEIPVDYPRLLRQMVESAAGAKTLRELAKELGISPTRFVKIMDANRPRIDERVAPAGRPARVDGGERSAVLRFRRKDDALPDKSEGGSSSGGPSRTSEHPRDER